MAMDTEGNPESPRSARLETESFLGAMKGTATVPSDLDEPLPLQWEAAETASVVSSG